jgi:hypothetical protein
MFEQRIFIRQERRTRRAQILKTASEIDRCLRQQNRRQSHLQIANRTPNDVFLEFQAKNDTLSAQGALKELPVMSGSGLQQ